VLVNVCAGDNDIAELETSTTGRTLRDRQVPIVGGGDAVDDGQSEPQVSVAAGMLGR
jgi:hypothetical protein